MSIKFFSAAVRRHARREDGASLVEFAIVFSLFLLIFFALLDFGRLGFNWVMTEKAMQRAARIATVRPPVCENVPETHGKISGSDERFGTLCSVGGACVDGGTQQCVLSAAEIDCEAVEAPITTAEEIWCTLQPIMPSNATPANIRVAYSYDGNLGFVGGPYTPMVEVGVVTAGNVPTGGEALNFTFITPLGGLAGLVGGAIDNVDANNQIPFPDMTVTLPGEDLNQGNNG